MSLVEIKKLLPKLTPQERKQVRSALNALDKVDGVLASEDHKPNNAREHMMPVQVLSKTLQDKGYGTWEPKLLRKNDMYPSFQKKALTTIKALRDSGVRDEVELEIILEIGIGLLIKDVQNWAAAVSPRILMANFDRVLPCLHAEFPDYLSNGLARWIVGGRSANKTTTHNFQG